jgi:hypothetical protein
MDNATQEISTTVLMWMGINPFSQPDPKIGRRAEEKHPTGTALSNKAGPRTSFGDHTLWAY